MNMWTSAVPSTCYIFLIFQLCSSKECMTKKPEKCVFPFVYENKTYTGCKPDKNNPERPWCSTQVDQEGRHIEGRGGVTWGVCSSDCDISCEERSQCIYGEECPEYKDFRKMSKNRTKDADYKTEINKWVSRICNKKEKKLCCSNQKFQRFHSPIKKVTPISTTEAPSGTNVCEGGQVYGGRYLPTLGQCGKFCATGRIHGGVNAGLGEFPWAALLGYTIRKREQVYPSQKWVIKKRTEFRCGGTLINTRYVLTAAHCHTGANKISSVVLGEWEVGKNPDCPQGNRDPSACLPSRQKIKVESVTVHENYNKDKTSGEVVNDIALVRLKEHAVLNEAVQPICLPLNENIVAEEIGIDNLKDGIVGRNSTIIGWGITENFGASKNSDCQGVSQCILQKVDIPIISNNECQSEVTKLSQNSTIRSSHICAVSRNDKDKDSCKGDSGGGMFISKDGRDETEGDDTFYQVGIVSYGLSRFCGIGYPGVYTRISEFIPWIEENLLD